MEIRIAVLADYVNNTPENKLNVMGVFTHIFAKDVPALHPTMSVVFQVSYELDEAGDYPLEIEFVNADGAVLQKISGPATLMRPAAGQLGTQNLIFNFVGQTFTRFGLYEYRLRIGQETQVNIPLEVIRQP